MRRSVTVFASLIVLAALAIVSLPALAAGPMTVEQLHKTLATAQAAHQSDIETVRQLADVELNAQLSKPALQQLIAISPGPKTTQALRGLADASAFFDPPVGELPPLPAPDFSAQKVILGKTIHYVARVLPTMPYFVATRSTEHFDDSPQAFQAGGWPVRAGLHLDGTFESSISVVDGEERSGPAPSASPESKLKKVNVVKAPGPRTAKLGSGLNSWGEFRTIMGIVLVDAAKGRLNWARWEKINGNSAAVFQFQIDRAVSHYDVRFSRNRPNQGSLKPVSRYDFRQISGYRGHIAIDPATGAVLRIQIDADMEPGSPIQRASMLVDYGPVELGPHTYICPVHSIALSTSDEVYQPTPKSPFVDLTELQINETTFSNYQRFGSDSTILTASHAISEKLNEAANAAPPAAAADSPAMETTASAQPAENPASAEPSPSTAAAGDAASGSASSGEAIAAAEVESDEEILVHAIESMPGEDRDSDDPGANSVAAGKPGSPTFKSTSRLVNVGLVAYDKHGKPITDLKQQDIEIYDNGRKQDLNFFRQAPPASQAPWQPTAQLPQVAVDTFTNATTIVHQVQDNPDLLILLIDEAHIAWVDLNRARSETLRFLRATRSNARIAVYAIHSHGFTVIQDVTQDHALAAQRLSAWMPSAQAVSEAQDLEQRTRQNFDTVRNLVDLNNVNGNYTEVPDASVSTDPELRQLGQNPLRDTLTAMISLARHFSSVPGHKCMAWISGDTALGDWDDRAVTLDKGPNTNQPIFLHAKEALNEARIALYVVNASDVQTYIVDPSLANQAIQLIPQAQDNADLAPGSTGRSHADFQGRANTQMQTDAHGIQGPVRELAESTGGRAIRKGGELKNTLDGILDDSAAHYDLGFHPDTVADGQYHTLTVRVPGRKDVKLHYRSGYLYTEDSTTTKERFQEAIWSPQDAGDLVLTAKAVPPEGASGEGIVKLHIAFPGIALQQAEGQRPDRWTDQLYIFVAVRDDAGQKAEVSGDTLRLSLKQASYDSGMPEGIPYQRAVEVKSKLGSVRVIVVDGNSGKMGSVTLPASALHP